MKTQSTEPTSSNQPEKRFHSIPSANALLSDDNNAAILKICCPRLRRTKTKRQILTFVDLRENALVTDKYINNHHPVSTFLDSAQHVAGKNLLCRLDCSQANHKWSTNGGSETHSDIGFQLWKQNICI